MNYCLITTQSMTLAMRVKSTLGASGIRAAVTRLPPAYTEGGCAYGVEISASAAIRARRVLQTSNIAYGKIICDQLTDDHPPSGRGKEGRAYQ